MATRSIIDIEVNDAAFQRFAEQFKKYTELLAKTPTAWADVGKQAKTTSLNFENLTAALLAQATFAHELNKESDKQTKHVERQASAWERMAKSSRGLSSHIADATKSLLQWGKLTGLISGLLGAGGLFGIDRLAQSATAQHRTALGLGASVGGMQAFGIAYGRMLSDPQSVLAGVAEGRYSVSGRAALMAAGLTPKQLDPSRDTADIADDLVKSIKRIVDRTPEYALGQVQGGLLTQFMSLPDLVATRRTTAKEIAGYDYTGVRSRLGVSEQSSKAWADFTAKLQETATRLGDLLKDHLVPLAEPLTHLSDSFGTLAAKLLDITKDSGVIDKIADGLQHLANVLGIWDRPELPGHGRNPNAPWMPDPRFYQPGGRRSGAQPPLGPWTPEGAPNPDDDPPIGYSRDYWRHLMHNVSYRTRMPSSFSNSFSGPQGSGGGDFSDLESKFGLPPGMLYNIEGMESGHGRSMMSSAGAEGWMQFMPGTWAQYGDGGSPYNRRDAATASAKYFRKLLGEFGGDLSEAVAGYNAGEGRVEDAVRRLGGRWLSGLPAETQNYVHKFFANSDPNLRGRSPVQVKIDINNQAGANHSISTSQLIEPGYYPMKKT